MCYIHNRNIKRYTSPPLDRSLLSTIMSKTWFNAEPTERKDYYSRKDTECLPAIQLLRPNYQAIHTLTYIILIIMEYVRFTNCNIFDFYFEVRPQNSTQKSLSKIKVKRDQTIYPNTLYPQTPKSKNPKKFLL